MDGQRRVARPMKQKHRLGRDCRLLFRATARMGAVAFLGMTLVHGVLQGGHLIYPGSPWLKLPGKLSGLVGLAADDIRMTGLNHHDPAMILTILGVKPGGTLMGFDPAGARKRLESLDWVSSAGVQQIFPNQLEITLVEREPFAVWQSKGRYFVIDKAGVPMSGLDPSDLKRLPLVTGEGANVAAAALVNDLEAMPSLMLRVKAASRVGLRRWTLYLDNGVKIVLPETNVSEALAKLKAMDAAQAMTEMAVQQIDLRLPGRVVVGVAALPVVADANAKPDQAGLSKR